MYDYASRLLENNVSDLHFQKALEPDRNNPLNNWQNSIERYDEEPGLAAVANAAARASAPIHAILSNTAEPLMLGAGRLLQRVKHLQPSVTLAQQNIVTGLNSILTDCENELPGIVRMSQSKRNALLDRIRSSKKLPEAETSISSNPTTNSKCKIISDDTTTPSSSSALVECQHHSLCTNKLSDTQSNSDVAVNRNLRTKRNLMGSNIDSTPRESCTSTYSTKSTLQQHTFPSPRCNSTPTNTLLNVNTTSVFSETTMAQASGTTAVLSQCMVPSPVCTQTLPHASTSINASAESVLTSSVSVILGSVMACTVSQSILSHSPSTYMASPSVITRCSPDVSIPSKISTGRSSTATAPVASVSASSISDNLLRHLASIRGGPDNEVGAAQSRNDCQGKGALYKPNN